MITITSVKKVACHISKKGCHSHQATIAAPWWALRKLRMETNRCHCQALSHCRHPQLCTLRGLRMERSRILAPGSWGTYQRDEFNEPSLLHLPIHRKVLNLLTWDIWFSLINSTLLMFQLPGLHCKNSYISWLPPYLFIAVPQGYSEKLSPGLEALRKFTK